MHQAPSSLKVSIITGGVKVINKGYHDKVIFIVSFLLLLPPTAMLLVYESCGKRNGFNVKKKAPDLSKRILLLFLFFLVFSFYLSGGNNLRA